MANKKVKGIVRPGNKIKLIGDPHDPPLDPGQTFRVTRDDSLHWDFEAVPAESTVLLTFDGFPPPNTDPPIGVAQLLDKGNVLASRRAGTDRKASIDAGSVKSLALEGKYTYTVHLLREDGTVTALKCEWETGWSAAEMGGGEKSGKPRGVAD